MWWIFTVCSYNSEVALFPASPCVQTKDRMEREEPSRIYHVRNVIVLIRPLIVSKFSHLITISGQMNKITMMLYSTHSVEKVLWPTERDYAELHYIA